MARRRGLALGAGVLVSGAVLAGAAGCGGPGTAAPPTTATATTPGVGTPSTGPSAPRLADEDLDEARVCLFLPLDFLDATTGYQEWQAAGTAGTAPPQPTEQVAGALETAVADTRDVVVEAPEGAVRTAGGSVLAEATTLAAALRSGGGQDGSALDAAFTELAAACPG